MEIRIVIDANDAAECPETPFTLFVYSDESPAVQSDDLLEINGEQSLIGTSIPAMLRALADDLEANLPDLGAGLISAGTGAR